MGRTLTGAFGAGTISQGVFNLKAGANISQNDALELGPDGKAYPVQVTDYAAVANVNYGTPQTNAATGQIVAQTQVVAAQTTAYYRQAVLNGADGSIYTVTANAPGPAGVLLSKYSAAGALLAQAIAEPTAAFVAQQAFFLNNGNICVFANSPGVGGTPSFWIYDPNLVQIKGMTSLPETSIGPYGQAVALSGGGFAIVYQQNANPLLSRLVAYDNAGNVVLAPVTIWTRTGTTGMQFHRMAQLSNGNLVIAVSSTNTVSSIGLYHGIVTTGGASVLAFTNLDPIGSGSAGLIPEISVTADYYAVSRANGTNQLAWVFDNTGTLRGSGFSAPTTIGTGMNTTKLVTDGTQFWMIWPRSSDSKEVLTKLPTTGTGYVTTALAGTGFYNLAVDAFCENGLIAAVALSSAAANPPLLWVINAMSGQLVSQSVTNIGSTSSTGGQYQRVIPGGDFSFICLYDYASTASTNLCVGKYANTAVMGVAQAFAAPNALVPCAGIAGGYAANYIKGSPSKTFDNSATNIYGNKGALLNYGVVLKGF